MGLCCRFGLHCNNLCPIALRVVCPCLQWKQSSFMCCQSILKRLRHYQAHFPYEGVLRVPMPLFARHGKICSGAHKLRCRSDSEESCHLELAAEHRLSGNVEGLTVLTSRAPGLQRDAVLLSFRWMPFSQHQASYCYLNCVSGCRRRSFESSQEAKVVSAQPCPVILSVDLPSERECDVWPSCKTA